MDKTERILDAIANPEKCSSAEIEEILKEADAKETLDLLDKTKSSLQQIPTTDIENEWIRFKNKNLHKRKKAFLRVPAFFSGKIAASFIIAIISISAIAAIVGISVSFLNDKENMPSGKEVTETEEVIVNQEDSLKAPLVHSAHPLETVVFDNEPLEIIMKQIGEFYGCQIEFKNDYAKSLRLYFRWNQTSTINEIVESLNNFEQIHITIEGRTFKID